jgi:energy-converting hydrogenase B subunit D
VLARDPWRQVIVNGIYGLSLALLFVILQAPDVALSMLVVNTVAYPLVLLVAIGVIRHEEGEDE